MCSDNINSTRNSLHPISNYIDKLSYTNHKQQHTYHRMRTSSLYFNETKLQLIIERRAIYSSIVIFISDNVLKFLVSI